MATSAAGVVPPLPVLKDRKAAEHLKTLEPYLLDRTERRRLATRSAASRRNNNHAMPTLPSRSKPSSSNSSTSRLGIRRFLRSQIHLLTFYLMHVFFSIYIRLRQAYHAVLDHVISVFAYHHNTPELIQRDVRPLKKFPEHLSVVLALENHHGQARGRRRRGSRGAGLETLINEVADIAAWCASAGIPVLSVYEKTGILKSYLPETHLAVSQKLSLYFGRHKPALSLSAPDLPSLPASFSPTSPSSSDDSDSNPSPNGASSSSSSSSNGGQTPHLHLLLLSAEDGRDSIVDLTKTLAEMSQRGKLSPSDISVDVVDAELKEGVVGEPDLLVIFGPYPDLEGYPPWQLRLTEIFSLRDNTGVGYQVFLKALFKYANAEMRWGR